MCNAESQEMSLFPLREELATGGGAQIDFFKEVFIVPAIFVYAKGYPSIHTFLGVYALQYIAYRGVASDSGPPCKILSWAPPPSTKPKSSVSDSVTYI